MGWARIETEQSRRDPALVVIALLQTSVRGRQGIGLASCRRCLWPNLGHARKASCADRGTRRKIKRL